ncbi:unnamed protein product [Psylliodes chrysocephalus]|uniref:Uncharacterized protein n=1 Tax=Psylliodes chrysocephalus TaxID=3402493 RepID=A0A9P0D4K9_9CUCU|nr:unnamed protein product [Psylliodes chrysocephala]
MSANCYKNTYKMIIVSIILLLAIIPNSITVEIADVETSLSKVLNFIDEQVDQFGLDGIFGVVIAQSQMIKILNLPVPYIILSDIRNLITKCQLILENSKKFLPIYPSYMLTFKIRLLNSKNWIRSLPDNITFGDIPNTGFLQKLDIGNNSE